MAECSVSPLENDSHIVIHVDHFDDHKGPPQDAVPLINNGDNRGSQENEDPVEDIEGGDEQLELEVPLEVRDVHQLLD